MSGLVRHRMQPEQALLLKQVLLLKQALGAVVQLLQCQGRQWQAALVPLALLCIRVWHGCKHHSTIIQGPLTCAA